MLSKLIDNIFLSKALEERNEYIRVQSIAKETIKYIRKVVKPGMNLIELRNICEEKLLELGADSFWYYDIGALVYAGDETSKSVSGVEYTTSDYYIKNDDIVTIDLSPKLRNIWGDYARTIIIEDGYVVDEIEQIKNVEWKNGLMMEEKLHDELYHFLTVNSTFEELYYHMNEFIIKNGFINLDFNGNLGHSIVKNKKNRIYIEKENNRKLSDVEYFTFEPHITMINSKYGYKRENIYYFDKDKLFEL